ncbi:transient receptor potential cation channel subfamily a member 1-like [Gigaspora margarita]|uniref:Transient receptor potential cation channel subfamily a member 1-like n=1 Tax=Gigaspora margarita TaxID=4874 RepID=A0A8H4EV41_GIGMA|nr:transient receptor potential cation channel subfamily a member 1-like [Gigaspora margarita]
MEPSEQHIQITENFIPHNGKPVTKIVSSPNMKYVATWSSEDRSVVGWNIIDNLQELKHECTILHNHVDYDKCPELFIHENIITLMNMDIQIFCCFWQ